MTETTIDTMTNQARVWIYQSDRLFTNEEVVELNLILTDFNNGWSAHGKKLNSKFEIIDKLFVVLIVDESGQNATGCSIDSSVAIVKQINETFKVDLLDRLNIAYVENGKLAIAKMFDFQEKIKSGEITKETLVFNNLLSTYGEFKSSWKTQAKNSWHANLFM